MADITSGAKLNGISGIGGGHEFGLVDPMARTQTYIENVNRELAIGRIEDEPRYGQNYVGTYKIQGQSVQDGDPVPFRRVLLLPSKDRRVIAERITDLDGNFVFDLLAPGKYTVVGLDINGIVNGVIFTEISAAPM